MEMTGSEEMLTLLFAFKNFGNSIIRREFYIGSLLVF
jgi:hypothetical protein|tara:strand:- start:127 stop:237 length:111 start_codon:yes stop_codon:yes gene_type:complete